MENYEDENSDEDDSQTRRDKTGLQHCIHVILLFLFMWQSVFKISASAISLMLLFFKTFFSLAARYLGVVKLQNLSNNFPHSLYRAKKFLGQLNENFTKFVACPRCHKLYKYEECWTANREGKETKLCSFVKFPRHTLLTMRRPCGEPLLQAARTSSGTTHLVAFNTYCYKSIVSSLEEILNRPNINEMCEKWRTLDCKDGMLDDVYDGNMWKHFQYDAAGLPFLAAPNNYLLMLNCDWFQPFTHTQFSVGVLYIAIQNLPRYMRYKQQNIIVVGIMPGPTEPSGDINTYLEPLMQDLEKLWSGIEIHSHGKSTKIRAAISCLACDVPAARKVGGFVGHRGYRSCTRCYKTFPTANFGDYPDYSGFKKSDWEVRSHALHVWYARRQKMARTKSEKKSIESEFGVRYSVLYELPYYNSITSCVIDPMHCLFLGIAKKFFKVWMANNYLNQENLQTIQDKVNSFKCPPDIGRIPHKIVSRFSGLKADQWKSWTLHFSLFSLRDILPQRDYNCWHKFVQACTLICRRSVPKSDLSKIDKVIEGCCSDFECLYGKNNLTPNMHLAAHITDCIADHGPVYAFWLFAFERMNGIMGSIPTNNHQIPIQLMRRLTCMQTTDRSQWPSEFESEFSSVLSKLPQERGSLAQTTDCDDSKIKPLPPVTEKVFDESELQNIKTLLNTHYTSSHIEVLRLHKSMHGIALAGIKLASKSSRYGNSSKIFIKKKLFEIIRFVKCYVLIKEEHHTETVEMWLVKSSPYMEHPCQSWFGYPTQVWASTLENDYQFYMIEEITDRVVHATTKINFGRPVGEDNVLIVSPLPMK